MDDERDEHDGTEDSALCAGLFPEHDPNCALCNRPRSEHPCVDVELAGSGEIGVEPTQDER